MHDSAPERRWLRNWESEGGTDAAFLIAEEKQKLLQLLPNPTRHIGHFHALLWPAFTFFDPNDPACQEILYDPKTTVPELFAIIRQWVPQVQHKIDVIGSEILKRGCHVNDRDGLTDMTLLHYACKAGAHGVGEPAGRGAGRGTGCTLLSWRVDASPWAVSALCLAVLNSTCSDFNHGTALHIAASNLCLGAVKCLLEHGANPAVRNSKGQVPADVVPDPMDMTLDKAEAAMVAKELKQLLLDAVPLSCNLPKVTLPNYDNIPGNLMLTSLGLKLGERVVVDGQKVPAPRVSCYWFGIELDKPTGKHDGSVFGVRYFSCSPKHGVFAPPSRVQRYVSPGSSYSPVCEQPSLSITGGWNLGNALASVRSWLLHTSVNKPLFSAFSLPLPCRIGGPKDSQGDSSSVKKVHQVTMSQPKRNFTAVRTPKDITSENSISRLLFCCWFPWMLRAEMQS
uniref:CAP-Gly domain-containing protein n=1 Tax=Terrapene triunguis TaxID=2587831 RepID=A0A674II24_9SAUR